MTRPDQPEHAKPTSLSTRFEGNLAEFPFGVFEKRSALSSYSYTDEIEGPNGAKIPRIWTIKSAHPEGLPTATTQAALFVILQLAHERDWQEREFSLGTLYGFLQRLGLPTGGFQYKQLLRDIDLLNNVVVDARNAFWNPETKKYVSKLGFKLFRDITAYSDQPLRQGSLQLALPMSRVVFEDFFFDLCKTNYVRVPLSSEEFLSLNPTMAKLALYLSKVLGPAKASTHYRDLYKLAEQIPIRAEAKRNRKAKLKQAVEGLLRVGFPLLEGYEITKSARGDSEIITFHRRAARERRTQQGRGLRPRPANAAPKDPEQVEYLITLMAEATGTGDRNHGLYRGFAQSMDPQLIHLAISELKEAHHGGQIRTDKARVFYAILKRLAAGKGTAAPGAKG